MLYDAKIIAHQGLYRTSKTLIHLLIITNKF